MTSQNRFQFLGMIGKSDQTSISPYTVSMNCEAEDVEKTEHHRLWEIDLHNHILGTWLKRNVLASREYEVALE